MQEETYIPNSGSSIASYYIAKGTALFCASLSGIFAYMEQGINTPYWYLFAIGACFFVFLADAVAMPIAHLDGGIRFHHLWRTSVLYFSDVYVFDIGSGWQYKFQRKDGEKLMFATGRKFWMLYIVYCNKKNDLAEKYKDY
jgi:hypothetical protein